METSLIIAGFGGQGIILMGQLIGYAATAAGLNATFYPAYGAEQRGGTANCTVVVSDGPIGSPVVTKPDYLVAMNAPSLDRFEACVREGGTIIVNSSLVERKVGRADVRAVYVPVAELAARSGSDKAANMAMLGSLVGLSGILPEDLIIATMKEKLAAKAKFLPMNEAAIRAGSAAARGGEGA